MEVSSLNASAAHPEVRSAYTNCECASSASKTYSVPALRNANTAHDASNPTLSYTQRLERRIQELEDQLADLNTSPSASYSSISTPGNPAVEATLSGKRERGQYEPPFSPTDLAQKSERAADSQPPFTIFPPHSNEISSDADQKRRQRLVHNARQQRALEDLAGIPAPFHYLLNIHWFWVHPIFNCVYRPAFTRKQYFTYYICSG